MYICTMNTISIPKTSGIYCIQNILNNKKYIGSSVNMRTRLDKHRSLLRNNKHENRYLQSSFNKNTEEVFKCFIVETCTKEELLNTEIKWFKLLQPEYNITKDILRNTPTPESSLLISKTLKRKYASGEIISLSKKEVYQYSLTGQYLRSFESIEIAAKIINCHRCTIDRAIHGQKGKNIKTGKGYQWSLHKVDKKEDLVYNAPDKYCELLENPIRTISSEAL